MLSAISPVQRDTELSHLKGAQKNKPVVHERIRHKISMHGWVFLAPHGCQASPKTVVPPSLRTRPNLVRKRGEERGRCVSFPPRQGRAAHGEGDSKGGEVRRLPLLRQARRRGGNQKHRGAAHQVLTCVLIFASVFACNDPTRSLSAWGSLTMEACLHNTFCSPRQGGIGRQRTLRCY